MRLTHRDRVLTALEHSEPDRVPIDFGGTQTSILVEPYNTLKRTLDIQSPTETHNLVLGLARVEEPVLERFDVDFRHVLPRPADTWALQLRPDDSFTDEWGIRWHRPPDGHYYDMVEHPLASASLDALESHSWPDPMDPGRVEGVTEEVNRLREETDYAIEAGLVGLWESAWFLVGLEKWLLVLNQNPPFVEALLDAVLKVLKTMHSTYLDEVGSMLDVVTLWDDYGAQDSTLISPHMWRRWVKPRLAELVATIKQRTSAYMALHSCGSLCPILDDLVEVGIEILNPVQVSASGMNPWELKRRYGKNISFWGAIDSQRLLPYGSVEDVEQAVRQTIQILAPGGGYVLAAVHNIQPGVPPDNVITMFDTARRDGTYPLGDEVRACRSPA
jgi:uroporphyrinogen decarboxylase